MKKLLFLFASVAILASSFSLWASLTPEKEKQITTLIITILEQYPAIKQKVFTEFEVNKCTVPEEKKEVNDICSTPLVFQGCMSGRANCIEECRDRWTRLWSNEPQIKEDICRTASTVMNCTYWRNTCPQSCRNQEWEELRERQKQYK